MENGRDSEGDGKVGSLADTGGVKGRSSPEGICYVAR